MTDAYVYEQKKNSQVYKTVWVPLVPIDGAYAAKVVDWLDAGSVGSPPPLDASEVKVVLKTTHCPDDAAMQALGDQETVQGLVINQVESISGDTRKLLQSNFPAMDVANVLILEEGRGPPSLAFAAGMTFGGIALFAAGAVLSTLAWKNR